MGFNLGPFRVNLSKPLEVILLQETHAQIEPPLIQKYYSSSA
jgi:hypothetical protein